MSSSASAVAEEIVAPDEADAPASVSLRGTGKGLTILVTGAPTLEHVADSLTAQLAEAPSFWKGNRVRVAVDGALPAGALARLEQICTTFDLTIVEVGPATARPLRAPGDLDSVPQPGLAEGSARIGQDGGDAEVIDEPGAPDELESAPATDVAAAPGEPAAAASVPAVAEALLVGDLAPGPRLVLGPVRSGVVLEHPGHVVVFGDVNPGAEVRAEGNIVVLGRLKGVAHAGVGRDAGFILALSLQPQQLRVGRLVARAGADDSPGDGAEIAYATGKTIVVERYQGRLPSGLAASM